MREKLIASGIHLLISGFIGIAAFCLLSLYWFPGVLMQLGAIEGIKLLLIVDVVLGPVCTFVVYKKGKSTLILDLSVIALMQFGALTYGLFVIHSQAPSYLVLTHSGIEVVTYLDEKSIQDLEGFQSAKDEIKDSIRFEGVIPLVLLREEDNDAARQLDQFNFEFTSSLPFALFFERYVAISNLSGTAPLIFGGFQQNEGCFEMTIYSGKGSLTECLYQENDEILVR